MPPSYVIFLFLCTFIYYVKKIDLSPILAVGKFDAITEEKPYLIEKLYLILKYYKMKKYFN